MRRKAARWIPAVAVPAVVIAASIALPSLASATGALPTKSADQLLSMVAASGTTAFSGTLDETANLGLPTVPSSALGGSGSAGGSSSSEADALGLLTGSHTARVFASGEGAQRVQVVTDLAEQDVIRSGRDVWAYDSQKKQATHTVLPDRSSDTPPSGSAPRTPAEVIDSILAQVQPVTTITTAADVTVAGRDAYELVLTPKDSTTLVRSVSVAVDATTGLPLRTVVSARGQADPAFSVAFTSIDVSAPAASTFSFTPPAGATVTEQKAPTRGDGRAHESHATPTVVGSGWSTVIGSALPAGSASAAPGGASSGDQVGGLTKALDQAFTPVSGGKVLQTALFSVYLTTDGHVFVGAVPADRLVTLATS